MPYVQGAGVHGVIHVADVYKSNNVYANNVQVALWQAPGTSEAFAFAVIADPVELEPGVGTAVETQTAAYIANPSSFYNPQAERNGVKGNFAPITVTEVSTGTNVPTPPTTAIAADIVPFLNHLLGEAGRGMWRESGQGGNPSNPNIVNIWKELGFPAIAYWQTDQTPWCMGFVNWVLKKCGYRWCKEAGAPAIKAKPSRWNATSVPINAGQPGDIVLWNFSHVSFILTADNGKYTFCGGNQTPSSGKNNNPADGDLTISWKSGWTPSRGSIDSIWRPSKS
jgi:uncharacterized protein (TIGR02594 family)